MDLSPFAAVSYPERVRPRHIVGLVCLAFVLVACDDEAGDARQTTPDAAQPSVDAGPTPAVPDTGGADDGADPGDAAPTPDAAPPACANDDDCGDLGWCDGQGFCEAAADAPFVAPLADGVTRAGAAGFDITPGYLEPWTDRAGPGCPGNRPGRFDGRLDDDSPDDPCADGFEDLNGDGVFDAVWVAGDGLDRPAHRVDNDNPPEGRVLVLTRDDTLYLLVTLDVHAVDAARVRTFTRRLGLRLGVPVGRVAVHATGNRSGPDAVGMSGPSLARSPAFDALLLRIGSSGGLLAELPAGSGTSEAWWDEVTRRCAAAARQAGARLAPVELRVATTTLPVDPDPPFEGAAAVHDADGDSVRNDRQDLAAWRAQPRVLSRDDHLPAQRDDTLRALALQSTIDRRPVAYVMSWGAAPAASPLDAPLLSGDFAGIARRYVETAHPGAVALWLTGAVADTVLGGRGARVPRVDDAGRLLDADGDIVDEVDAAADAQAPVKALGRLLGARALRAIDLTTPSPAELSVTGRFAWVPLTNPRVGLAARLGVMARLGDWIMRRVATNGWSSGETTPACGGLGCVRYRLDRVDLGAVTLLALPGAPDGAYARGREPVSLSFGDERNLRDLDGDGLVDEEDADIRVHARGQGRETVVVLDGPANPQRFDAVHGLAGPGVWLVGRTNGGVGSLRGRTEHVNVFEGGLEPLAAFVASPDNAAVAACPIWPCTGELTLGELTRSALDAQPQVLADLAGAHELWVVDADFGDEQVVDHWWIADAEEALVAGGRGSLVLGPGNRVFAPEVDFVAAGIGRGHHLVLDAEDYPSLLVGGVVPVELRRHPNAGQAWDAATPEGGDLVYNTACELLFDGPCPHPRPTAGDPNQSLPRAP